MQFVFAERAAVRGEVVLLLRAAIADVRAHQDQRGPALGLRLLDGVRDVVGVVAIRHRARVPAICLETLGDVFGEIELGGAGERNVVLIVEVNQLAQLQVAGQRRRFLA